MWKALGISLVRSLWHKYIVNVHQLLGVYHENDRVVAQNVGRRFLYYKIAFMWKPISVLIATPQVDNQQWRN